MDRAIRGREIRRIRVMRKKQGRKWNADNGMRTRGFTSEPGARGRVTGERAGQQGVPPLSLSCHLCSGALRRCGRAVSRPVQIHYVADTSSLLLTSFCLWL